MSANFEFCKIFRYVYIIKWINAWKTWASNISSPLTAAADDIIHFGKHGSRLYIKFFCRNSFLFVRKRNNLGLVFFLLRFYRFVILLRHF